MSRPSSCRVPESNGSTPETMLRMVLLPAPFSPISPTTSPPPTVRCTPSRARSPPNALPTSWAANRGSCCSAVTSPLPIRGRTESRCAVVVRVERAAPVELAVALGIQIGLGVVEAGGFRYPGPDRLQILDRVAVELQVEVVRVQGARQQPDIEGFGDRPVDEPALELVRVVGGDDLGVPAV